MRKKMYFLTLDTETATLPFANQIAKNPKQKQTIAIAKPLCYDIGWVISDRQGNIIKKENFLVQETFFVPNVFNTAYYMDKRPIYMEMFERGEITALPWNSIMELLLADCMTVDFVTAYNACFDFKKAIPFTERYIKHLYSADYNKWEYGQRKSCEKLIVSKNDAHNTDYLKPVFKFRDHEFPIIDLWGMACDRLINIDKYRNYCLENGLLTASGMYFKSSAETSFQYLMKQYDFVEKHTALDDAEIEVQILTKGLKKGKAETLLKPFPFRVLGYTHTYVLDKKPKYVPTVLDAYQTYLDGYSGSEKYASRIANIIERLENAC